MLSFRNFIFNEDTDEPAKIRINWSKPDAYGEHNEVHEQLHADKENKFMPDWVRSRMNQLANSKTWNNAVSKGQVRQFNHDEVKMTHNADKSWNDVTSEEKKNRVLNAVSNKHPIERPIYLEHPKTGERYLISGNTRSQLAHRFDVPIEAHVIQ